MTDLTAVDRPASVLPGGRVTARRRRALLATVAAVVGLAACGQPSGSGGASEAAFGSPSDASLSGSGGGAASPSAVMAAPDGLFALSDGRRLYLACRGDGAPTIVLEGGDGDHRGNPWPAVQARIAPLTRVCVYDRANRGSSDPAPGPRTAFDLAADLREVLDVAAVPGPYLLIGGSWGGVPVAAFAETHRERVAGIILPDAFFPLANGIDDCQACSLLTPAQIADYENAVAWDNPDNLEHIDTIATEQAVGSRLGDIPPVPITVVTATDVQVDCGDLGAGCVFEKLHDEEMRTQGRWADLSPKGRWVHLETDHNVYGEDPDAVDAIIRQMVAEIRGG